MSLPHRLLKYAASARFLENGLFRFSQPALNDPYEAFPGLLVNSYAAEDIEAARREADEFGASNISDEQLRALFLPPFPARRMDEKSFPGLWPLRQPILREKPFDTSHEYHEAIANRAVELGFELASKQIGILSLTESAQETMWAYYAENQRGLCITFDAKHPYFVGSIRPIEYSDTPIHVTINDGLVRSGGRTISTQAILQGDMDFFPDDLLWRKQTS